MAVIIPEHIQQAIDGICGRLGSVRLREGAARLMETYREKREAPALDEEMVGAYLAMRAPATYAAVCTVLGESIRRIPELAPESLLDLGSGPGTVPWAAKEMYPDLASMRAIESHPLFVAVGRELLPDVQWLAGDLRRAEVLPPADLVTASYSLGELPVAQRERLVQLAWEASQQALVVIEPGTPAGFAAIDSMRSQLIELGATIAAPCPHQLACPLAGTSSWCHFSKRLSRTRLHRQLKDAELGWEDEKFAFIIASKLAVDLPGVRVLGHPQHSKAHIRFEACTDEGTFDGMEVPRRDKESWKAARKLEWGDGF
ncbi:methyltransferase type 11 [bacterium]|nr:methyltransferase type 11 [bacterium]